MTMISRLSRFHINGAATIFVKSIANYCTTCPPAQGVAHPCHPWRWQRRRSKACTTTQNAQSQNGALADFLIKSLGFSEEAAMCAANKSRRSKPSIKKPALMVNYLENLGLERTQIRSIVSANPRLLFYDVDKILQPKVEFLRELGLSGSELVKVITASHLMAGLDSCIKPRTDYLRQLLGSDDRLLAALKRSYFILQYDPGKMEKNILVLKKYGISDESIARIVFWNPMSIFGAKPESLVEKLQRVENDLGIPRESPMFIYGVKFLNTHSLSKINLKFEALRSYGWSDEDILKSVRILPLSMNMSVERIRRNLDYYMKELGYSIDYLASRPRFFTFNLERRVKPRNEVLRILTKLKKTKASLYTVLLFPHAKFVKNYIIQYKDELPDMYEAYIKKVGIQKMEE